MLCSWLVLRVTPEDHRRAVANYIAVTSCAIFSLCHIVIPPFHCLCLAPFFWYVFTTCFAFTGLPFDAHGTVSMVRLEGTWRRSRKARRSRRWRVRRLTCCRERPSSRLGRGRFQSEYRSIVQQYFWPCFTETATAAVESDSALKHSLLVAT